MCGQKQIFLTDLKRFPWHPVKATCLGLQLDGNRQLPKYFI